MYHLPSIRVKIGVYSGVLLLLSMLAVIGYATYVARQEALQNAVHQARDATVVESLQIRVRFEAGLDAARATAAAFEGIRNIQSQPSREVGTQILKNVASSSDDFLGAWTTWEPNAYDGKDAEFVGTKGHDATGRFLPYWNKVGGMHLEPCNSYDSPGNDDWYKKPRDSGQEMVMEPYSYDIGGKMTMVVSLAVPVKVKGKSAGVVGVDLGAGFLQKLSDSMTVFDGKARLVLFSPQGVIAAMTGRADLAGKPLSEGIADADQMLKTVENNEEFQDFSDGALRLVLPMSFGKADQVWGIAIFVPEGIIFAHASEMAWNLSLIGLLCLAVALVILIFLATVLSRPIRETAGAIHNIAEGNLDIRLEPRGRDEVAAMQEAVNIMAGRLKDNIEEIETQNRLAQEKTLQAEEATKAAEEARQMAEKARSEGMLQAAHKLERIVEGVSGASGDISRQAADVLSGSEHQKDRITQTATAMEEMNATVLEVARSAGEAAEQARQDKENAEEGSSVVNHTVTAIAGVQKKAESLKENMNSLGVQAESIGNIMTVIDDIADQTNLLALNAAIEAARAGDAGRGFAVVADEVRKLAEKTMNATKEVGDSIRSIQSGTQSNIEAMDTVVSDIEEVAEFSQRSGKVLENIVEGAGISAGRIQSIATAAEEQSATSEEINQSLEEINSIAGETAAAVAETAEASEGLAKQAAELQKLIEELKREAE
ncbi:MAG: methyl-accepting chemotaxis protein [Desulfovibrio sp.]|uniref:methyl-accepting chemotaxis protein n=1 Tax=Desulfovibrio sp. 7SRBS1 TaxID=3378064 RepID=UPI003B41440D